MAINPGMYHCPHIRLGELIDYLNGLDLPRDTVVNIGPSVAGHTFPSTIGGVATTWSGDLYIEPWHGASLEMYATPMKWQRDRWVRTFQPTETD
jgi:hypothetical protein